MARRPAARGPHPDSLAHDDDPLPVWQTALIWGAALVLGVLVAVGALTTLAVLASVLGA